MRLRDMRADEPARMHIISAAAKFPQHGATLFVLTPHAVFHFHLFHDFRSLAFAHCRRRFLYTALDDCRRYISFSGVSSSQSVGARS